MKHHCRPVASILLVFAAFGAGVDAQTSHTRPHVETLASPRLEGRLAGSNGERLASDYLASELQKIGAKPLPGKTDLRLPFEFTAGTRDGGSSLSIRDKTTGLTCGSVGAAPAATAPTDPCVRALSFSDNGDVD